MKTLTFFIFVVLSSICLVANSQTAPLFYYPFNGNTNDESGNGNTCTNNGATLTNDRFGNANSAYYFDGQTNFMEITPASIALKTMSDFTLSLWMKKDGWKVAGGSQPNTANKQVLFDGHAGDKTATTNIDIFKPGIFLSVDYTVATNTKYLYGLLLETISPSVYNEESIAYPISETWNHVVFSRKGTVTYLYYNDILIDTKDSMNATITNMFHQLYIGTALGDNPNYYFTDYNFQGSIDDISLWNIPSLPISVVSNIQNESVPLSKDGSIDLTISGGIEPYNVTWDNGMSGKSINGLSKGTYIATITDAIGTKFNQTITIASDYPDPIAYYPFNNNTVDETGHGNTCVNVNAQLINDRFGNPNSAFYFDGMNSYLEITPQSEEFKTMTDFTIAMWFKKDGWQGNRNNPTNRQYLFCGHSGLNTETDNNSIYKKGFSLALDYDNSSETKSYYEFLLDSYSPTSYKDQTIPQAIPQTWNFVVFQRKGDVTSLYENGTLVTTKTGMNSDISNMFHSLYLGTFNGNNPNYYYSEYNYRGAIDEVTIWNKALDSKGIEYLMTKNTNTFAISEDTLSIKGHLNNADGSNCKGNVIAFDVDKKIYKPIKYDLIQNDQYIIPGLHKGKYIVFCVPDNSNGSSVTPTYFPSEKFWQNAFNIDLNGEAYSVDINLSGTQNTKPNGLCKIKGKVIMPDSISVTHNYFETKKDGDKTVMANMPVLLLLNEKIIDWTITDSIGSYSFNQLDYGTYSVAVEYQNVATTVKPVTLKSGDVESIDNNLLLQTKSNVVNLNITVAINPNITNHYATIVCPDFISYTIVNSDGIIVVPSTNNLTIDISNLPSGIYYVKVISQNTISSLPIMKF